MTLVWHDWFATSNDGVGSQRLMILQNGMFRRLGLGSFPGLTAHVTANPAMLIYLSGLDSEKGAPNENYARELMELFTLGHGSGYTERDVREQARALTGLDGHLQERRRLGAVPLRPQPPRRRDEGRLRQGRPFTWSQAVQLAVEHPAHAPFFTRKLWSYFIPVPADPDTQAALEALYVQSGRQIRPGPRGDPEASAAPHRPADDEAARRLPRRDAPDAGRPDRDRGLHLAVRARGAAPVLTPRTCRAGTTIAGSTRPRSGALAPRRPRAPQARAASRPHPARRDPRRPGEARRARDRVLGRTRRCPTARATRSSRTRAG